MPLLTFSSPPAKGTTVTVTLDKSYLMSMPAVTTTDEYFADPLNVSKVVVVYESEPGKQRDILQFDFSLSNPTAPMTIDAHARNNFFFKFITIFDFEQDKIKLTREQIVLSDESIVDLDISFGPMESTNDIVVTPSSGGTNLYEDFASFFVEKSGSTMTGALVLPGDPSSGLQASTKNYVDSKIEDAIADGVTSKAPSQNAVYDALAAKMNTSGSTMSGTLNMNSNSISNASHVYIQNDPLLSNEAATKNYVDSRDTLLSNRIGALESDPVTKNYVDSAVGSKVSTSDVGVSVASLVGGKVPSSQLPNSIMEYQGTWNASTNTPTLANGAIANAADDAGHVYRVSVAGTVNFGAGNISFDVGDYAILNYNLIWEKSDTTDAVSSVAGRTGDVTLSSTDLSDFTTAVQAITIDASKIGSGAVSNTEFGYLDGVSSAIQTQIDGKQATITGGATTITSSNLTASKALVSDSGGKVAASSVSSTTLGYLDATSSVQTQIDGKQKVVAIENVSNSITLSSAYDQRVLLANTTSSAISITGFAATAGFQVTIIDYTGNSNVNYITFVRSGSQKIQGLASDYVMKASFGTWVFTFDGTDWWVS